MAPKSFGLHNQDLDDAMQHLKTLTDRRAHEVFAVAQRGELHPLNEATLKPLRSVQDTIFHDDVYSSPILSGNEDLPFDALPTVGEIQEALTQDISSKKTYRFAPSRGTCVKTLKPPPNCSRTSPTHCTTSAAPSYTCLRLPLTTCAQGTYLGPATASSASRIFK